VAISVVSITEFHILAESGEDQLLVADQKVILPPTPKSVRPLMLSRSKKRNGPKRQRGISTPKLRTIDDLSKATGIPAQGLVQKPCFFLQ